MNKSRLQGIKNFANTDKNDTNTDKNDKNTDKNETKSKNVKKVNCPTCSKSFVRISQHKCKFTKKQ